MVYSAALSKRMSACPRDITIANDVASHVHGDPHAITRM